MHFCALLALVTCEEKVSTGQDDPHVALDRMKVVKMALVHDLAEATVGTVLPNQNNIKC